MENFRTFFSKNENHDTLQSRITVWKLGKEDRLANDENFAVHQINDINSEPVSNSLLPYLQALLVPNFILMVLFLELEQQTGL